VKKSIFCDLFSYATKQIASSGTMKRGSEGNSGGPRGGQGMIL